MELVEKIVAKLKEANIANSLDVRVTYSHRGVKVSISYWYTSEKQTKPFLTTKEAMLNALENYLKVHKHYSKAESHFSRYSDSSLDETFENISKIRLEYATERTKYSQILVPLIDECIEITKNH